MSNVQPRLLYISAKNTVTATRMKVYAMTTSKASGPLQFVRTVVF